METLKPRKTQFKGVIMLLLTAFIWGTSFVAQSVGMESVEAFTFNGIRTLLGAVVLLPIILIRDNIAARKMNSDEIKTRRAADKKVLIAGAVLGVVLCLASNFQQFAFYYSTSGKIAFITSFYMMFVPFIGLFFKKRIPWLTWACVVLGIIGLFLLCVNPSDIQSINFGDVLALICAFFYAIHILLVEKFAPNADGLKLSCVQFAVSGTISIILMFIFETPRIDAILTATIPILYSGIMSCGFAYTFQIIGQKFTEATIASLLMCMESVFGVLASVILLREYLSVQEIIGCVIMFIAIIISQLPTKKKDSV